MKRTIINFGRDEEGDWVALLECGHTQHVRHNPPLVSRPWVLTEAGRKRFLGHELDCKRCDEERRDRMSLPVIEIYSSLDCPYAYLATYRLRQVWPDVAGRVQLAWRTLSLEYVNERPVSKPLLDAERPLFEKIDPQLPWEPWQAPDWNWPTTMWPAHEALACAQAQGAEAAFAMSWALRHAFFAQSKNVALRHEILAIARRVAKETDLDLEQFSADWDAGRHKQTVIENSHRGWHELQLEGSATFLLPDGQRVSNPAIGEVDFDEENYVLREYKPYEGNATERYRELLESVAKAGGPEPKDKMRP